MMRLFTMLFVAMGLCIAVSASSVAQEVSAPPSSLDNSVQITLLEARIEELKKQLEDLQIELQDKESVCTGSATPKA